MAPYISGPHECFSSASPNGCDLLSGLGPLFHSGRADDLPGFLLVPHVDRDLVAVLGQKLAYPLLGGVLGFENLRRQRPLILYPPFDLEAHGNPSFCFRPTVLQPCLYYPDKWPNLLAFR